jgi:hypothetical protein
LKLLKSLIFHTSHNPKVRGSNPLPATKDFKDLRAVP